MASHPLGHIPRSLQVSPPCSSNVSEDADRLKTGDRLISPSLFFSIHIHAACEIAEAIHISTPSDFCKSPAPEGRNICTSTPSCRFPSSLVHLLLENLFFSLFRPRLVPLRHRLFPFTSRSTLFRLFESDRSPSFHRRFDQAFLTNQAHRTIKAKN